MSVTTDTSAVQPDYRLVIYPNPDGSDNERGQPRVAFPGPDAMSEEDFARETTAAWPQLLQEHVRNHYRPDEDHGYIDTMVRHLLSGDMEQVKQAHQRAQAWRDARSGDTR